MSENENATQTETPTVAAEAKAEPPKVYPSPFFADGYTRLVTMPSDLTGFAPVRLTYRPICADENSQSHAWIRLNPEKPTIECYAPLLNQKIIGWDLAGPDGAVVEKSEKNIRRLAPEFYSRLLDVVSGEVDLKDETNLPGPTVKNS